MRDKQKMILELRKLTAAGISDCAQALEDSDFNVQNAVDLIKQKGKSLVSGKKVASEGLVSVMAFGNEKTVGMVEVNCVTDFVAKSPEFKSFCEDVLISMYASWLVTSVWSIDNSPELEDSRINLMSITKENIEIRRWWVEQFLGEYGKVFSYVHPNSLEGKIGVLLSLSAETEDVLNSDFFQNLGDNLAMQVAAMSPLAVSPEQLDADVIARQVAIFEAQIKELNKPEAAQKKIMEGKLNKWYKEVCLLRQESVLFPKRSITDVISEVEKSVGGKIKVVGFTRCQVGEGIEKPADKDFANEALEMAAESFREGDQ